MRISFRPTMVMQLTVVMAAFAVSGCAQSFLADLKSEHDPGRRAEMALSFADESFDSAKTNYQKGAIHEGDVWLENMTHALDYCVESAAAINKARIYKKAEMKVAVLQRRLSGLVDDLGVQERGWAEQTSRKLEELHDKLLAGVMRK